MSQPACELRSIGKRYGAIEALAGVDLIVHPGRVHAIVGENGAGKSTLVKILAGAETPNSGTITVAGRPARFASVADARRAGVSIVFQELSLFPELDVLANLAAFGAPTRFGYVSRRRLRSTVAPVVEELSLDIDLDQPVGSLDLHERQLVEIARALLEGASILVLDEPNSALNASESERLFKIVDRLAARGTAVLYVSHRLEEVFRISHLITVLRNGREVATVDTAMSSISAVVEAMIGRPPALNKAEIGQATVEGGWALRLEDVTVSGRLRGVDLVARAGEVVGLAGLEGAGQRTIFDLVFGRVRPDDGRVELPGGEAAPRTIRQAVLRGIAFVPPDRRLQGLMLDQSLGVNVAEVEVGALGRGGLTVQRRDLARRGRAWIDGLGIAGSTPSTAVGSLSGGNQQKTLLSKWLAVEPDVILLEDPTRGVDVGAKEEIHALTRRLAAEGRVVLFSSSELPEYLAVCDRVAVLFEGLLVGEKAAAALTEHELLEAINTGIVR